jgi:hypothetical protein
MSLLDTDVVLSTQAIRADMAVRWADQSGSNVVKMASALKRTVTGLTHAVQQNAQYWSAEEEASFGLAEAALNKLVRASEQAGQKRKVDEKTEAERIAQRSQEAQHALEGRLWPESRRERILVGYALSLYDGKTNVFADALRREMSNIDRRGLLWHTASSAEAIDAYLRDALTTDKKDLVWHIASRQQSVAELVAHWEGEFVRRLEATRAAAEAFANEIDVWLVKRAIVDTNAKGLGPQVGREEDDA